MIRSVAACPEVASLCEQVEHCVPAPSSFYGRFRGQVDVASFLAQDLSQRYGLSFQGAPWRLRFRWAKQAMRKTRRRARPLTMDRRGIETLLVDDVVTTGTTLAELADVLPGKKFLGLCLCRAR